ncbi:cysteine protease [Cryptotrichosporon argae]
MAFQTYQQGLKLATDTAQRAVTAEASLSKLAPTSSAVPTLQSAFALYVSSAEHYSRLLSSRLVLDTETAAVKKKMRLVLERAEKVKTRLAALGAPAGRVEVGAGEEDEIVRRSARVNGRELPRWAEPGAREFEGAMWEQSMVDTPRDAEVTWGEPMGEWGRRKGKWVVRQGRTADCSVAVALAGCWEHDRRWDSTLATRALYPQDAYGYPRKSQNGKHVAKLLFNGVWRSATVDSCLPSTAEGPLYITAHEATSDSPGVSSSLAAQTPPHIPLLSKAYLAALGGYDIPGSSPCDDIYAFTGWVPERQSMRHGFQREKTWRRVRDAWGRGEVLVSLGTGKRAGARRAGGRRLVSFHAHAVLDVREVGDRRVLEILDPGAPDVELDVGALAIGDTANAAARARVAQDHLEHRAEVFSMTWDEVCDAFETLELNWDPKLRPVQATRHWTWKAPTLQQSDSHLAPRFHLKVQLPGFGSEEEDEVWLLLSQHIVSKDRPLEDVALHVRPRIAAKSSQSIEDSSTPYANALHTLVRHRVRGGAADLTVTPIRDGGIHDLAFTLSAFASAGSVVSLDRDVVSLPFSQTVSGQMYASRAGGNHAFPTYHRNPQYKLSVPTPTRGEDATTLRVALAGQGEAAWNAKVVWGGGGQVFELTEGILVLDSGAYTHGVAHGEASGISSGTYTLIVSTFEPGQTGAYTVTVESSSPVALTEIPPEGAGMFHRALAGSWDAETAAGRPSLGSYERNPTVEVTLAQPASLLARLHLPHPAPVPLNLSLFARGPAGAHGPLLATSGPYVDALPGVALPRTRLEPGVYLVVLSTYERWAGKYELDVWADGRFEIERVAVRR